jgi:heme/copper-type cytochrome/quinol oxidase subunit 2
MLIYYCNLEPTTPFAHVRTFFPTDLFAPRFLRLAAALSLSFFLLFGCEKDLGPPDVKERLVMKKYEFIPPEIRVKQGQVVQLDVVTADVQHGLAVPELGIKAAVHPGAVTEVKFRAEKKGEFPMRCYILCGPGHDEMQGKIVVE